MFCQIDVRQATDVELGPASEAGPAPLGGRNRFSCGAGAAGLSPEWAVKPFRPLTARGGGGFLASDPDVHRRRMRQII